MTKTKYSVPWTDVTIKLLVKKRNKLYLCAHKSKNPDVKIHYKRFRAHVQKAGIILEWATQIFRVRIHFFYHRPVNEKININIKSQNENVNEDVNDDN